MEEEVTSGIICDPMDILYVLEINFAFYAWYKRGEPFPVTDMASVSAVKKSIRILLNSIKEFTPRNHGNGWKLHKFHEHLHLPMDIYMSGSPQNYDNSLTEHGLIETAKRPADHAQKSRMSFILETALIKQTHQALLHSQTEIKESKREIDFSFLPNSASFLIMFNEEKLCTMKWLGKHLKDCAILDEIVVKWMQQSKKAKRSFLFEVDEFHVHLEYVQNGVTF